MKSLSLLTSAVLLLSATSAFAITCSTLPSCKALGYNDTASHCPKSSRGEEMFLKCPFDHDKDNSVAAAKCIYEAAVGQIAYFTKAPDKESGWILCNGQSVSSSMYPQLSKLLSAQFGGSDSTFNVPDYRGYFLRVYGTPKNSKDSTVGNTSLTTPQKEGLPNITGSINRFVMYQAVGVNKSGVFENSPLGKVSKGGTGNNGPYWSEDAVVEFDASLSNDIYGRTYTYNKYEGVVPANYAVYAYIYAGKVVK